MLTKGFNHVAVLTNDTDRFHAFSREVFDAAVRDAASAGTPARRYHPEA